MIDSGKGTLVEKLWPLVIRAAISDGQIKFNQEVIKAVMQGSPSDYLISRKVRHELKNLFIPLIEFEQNGAENFVKCVLQFHEIMQNENGGVCKLGKYHDVLYIAATVAENYNVTNHSVIDKLLKEIYSCEKCFDRLISPAILGPKVSHIMTGWQPDIENVERAIIFLAYFLRISNLNKIEFESSAGNKFRILDVPLLSLQSASPLSVAVQTNNLEAAKMLFQYGADSDSIRIQSLLSVVLKTLSDTIYDTLLTCKCLSNKNIKLANEAQNGVINLKSYQILRKQMNIVSPTSTKKTGCECKSIKTPWSEKTMAILNLLISCHAKTLINYIRVIHPRLVEDGILNFDPPDLSHLCRISIRRSLNDNWKIPEGIRNLNLPPTLKNYLYLETY